jgi:hypothetical protein
MVRCFRTHLSGRVTIMKAITSVLVVSVFASFFVWMSALATAVDADRRVPGWYGPHDPSPAWD